MTKQTEALKLALEAYLCREMPAGTIIGDPKWWVPKIAMVIRKALAEQPAQQEPVATNKVYVTREQLAEIYPPASKPWVGLTDEDSQDVIQRAMHSITGGDNTFTLSANKIWVAIVREVEAKLKEKNNG